MVTVKQASLLSTRNTPGTSITVSCVLHAVVVVDMGLAPAWPTRVTTGFGPQEDLCFAKADLATHVFQLQYFLQQTTLLTARCIKQSAVTGCLHVQGLLARAQRQAGQAIQADTQQ